MVFAASRDVRQSPVVPELLDIGWVVAGLVLLYYGAEWLVKGSSELAIRFGISPLVVGLTVVAFGTSAPELVVSVKANLDGSGGMAIGNVVGSNICNIALVLGVGAVIFPLAIQRQVIRREMPVLLVATVVFLLMMRGGVIDRFEAAVLFGGVILYVITSLVEARKEDPNVSEDIDPEVIKAARTAGAGRVFLNIFLIVIGALVLVVGADRMVLGGERIARFYGVPEAIIGLTLFAFGTSLPELATSVVAALRKHGDIIVGNAVGSCIFNLLAVIGLAGLVAPLEGEGLTIIHLAVMLGVTIILMPMMWHRMRLDRWEGVLLVVGYLVFTAWLVIG
ncbi:calcium/sodium antiporter [bacterium]|nr:calcium/sodium antiporter [bacterium]MDA7907939.1 calcium/sodium antiporter [Akkermansiaceae bacterium]MDA7929942.1 calcium/sodium antiporter [Akkermansiaceae bacterium]MDB4488271.1 calcium/sodium antiporter [bacterium]